MRLVFVKLDNYRLWRSFMRMAVVAAGTMDMLRGRGRGRELRGRLRSFMCVRVTGCTVRTAFRFKGFFNFIDDQMHRAQHVSEYMVWLYFQVIWLQFDGHMSVAQVISGARQVKRRAVVFAGRDAQY